MNKLYLVLNCEEEKFVIDICTNYNTANMLAQQYMKNFIENKHTDNASEIIQIEEVDINGSDIIWTYDD